ncbi:MAG: septum formation protein Maf [Thermogutta sp.]|nr:septum formation protein Maf [Thermogutta sp.]
MWKSPEDAAGRELILASNSPRRRELLAGAGYAFRVIPPDPAAEDGLCSGEPPVRTVVRLARQKAENVAKKVGSGLILGCDTIVVCGGQLLGKPADRDHARRILQLLRGQRHEVISGLCLWDYPHGIAEVRAAVSVLQMHDITDDAIDEYLATGLWEGKAGAFGYQDRLDWLTLIEGSESNVVGLPMELLAEMLARHGVIPGASPG